MTRTNGFRERPVGQHCAEVVASNARNESTSRSASPRDQHMGIAMANHPTKGRSRKTLHILQFRLWTIFVAMAAVAVLAALAKLFGKDGLFLGSIGVPLITGLVLIRGAVGGTALTSPGHSSYMASFVSLRTPNSGEHLIVVTPCLECRSAWD